MPGLLPLSLLNDFLFCPRRAALKIVEGMWGENEHTALGDVAHANVDVPGYHTARGVKVLRALPVWSSQLGLSGRCDAVEIHPDGAVVPVEFKKSRKKSFSNDDAQVCAQAICLESSLGVTVTRGAVFFSAAKHRREVPITAELRQLVEDAARDLHELAGSGRTPAAVTENKCEGCSLVEECLPNALRFQRGAESWFQARLSASLAEKE